MVTRLPRLAGLFLALIAAGAAAQPAHASPDLSSLADRVFTLVNQERAARGLKPFVRVGVLDRCAQAYALRMAREGFFSHTAPDGSTPPTRMQAAGYSGRAWGENIAAGQPTAEAVMHAWMNSPGHAANILNTGFTHIGLGVAAGGTYGIQWVQDFGTTAAPLSTPALPQLSSLSPATLTAGARVTLTGTGFGSPGAVTFNGSPAFIEQWSETQVDVRVPIGGTVGPVLLTNAYGSSNSLAGTAPSAPPAHPAGSGPVVSPVAAPTPAPNPMPHPAPVRLRLRSLQPASGPSGSVVHLLGIGFGSAPGQVPTSGATATVLSWSDSDVTVRIEGTQVGWMNLRVVRSDGRLSNGASFRLTR
jgi:uncharacterized protein YkwD